ncbi:hypothetical protein CNY89_01585 [Amaricoccus sp. HAR-UPW-R2A-40]|nr:hypothetical protein CNY89_01585 [Amaricoccus sp. HAR-UPW-R2A-40]
MTRVAVVGNSHLGAIKLGWEQVSARHPEMQVEFFAAPGTHYYRLEMFEPRKFGLPPGSGTSPPALQCCDAIYASLVQNVPVGVT